MIMIIGGAYQGKLNYAKKTFPDVQWIDGEYCEKNEIFQCEGIYHFHKYIERCMKDQEELGGLAEEMLAKNPQLIVVTDEIGYGIVPMDPFLREVREVTGRICTELAAGAKKVVRVVCGIPNVIKEDSRR